MKSPPGDSVLLMALSAVYLVTRLPFMVLMPFIQDEAIYAIMIEEQAAKFTLIPTFLGFPVSWKPVLFFWLNVLPSRLDLPLEVAYRFPSLLFGLATIPLLFRLLKNAGASSSMAFYSLLIFSFSMFTLYPQTTLLLDSMAFFLICLSLWLYSEKKIGKARFLGAAAAAAAAFLVKLVIAFMIPLLAVAYFLQCDKKMLKDRAFLLSLIAVPLSFFAYGMLLGGAGLAGETATEVGNHLLNPLGLDAQVNQLVVSFLMLVLSGNIIWISFSLVGFLTSWKENLFLSAWFLFTIFPFLGAAMLPWYYLPVMPAVGYFACIPLLMWKGKEKPDKVFKVFLALLIVFVSVATLYSYWLLKDFNDYREAGSFLSGKENVLIVGQYIPSVVAYKILPELRSGRRIDFGWIAFPDNLSADYSPVYAADYHSGRFHAVDGSFSSMFVEKSVFRKETNITKFDYVAVLGSENLTLPGRDIVFNRSGVIIYAGG
jgi:4-amino-4-deoxy-L-arabinose transferase-like glycosyltransferase